MNLHISVTLLTLCAFVSFFVPSSQAGTNFDRIRLVWAKPEFSVAAVVAKTLDSLKTGMRPSPPIASPPAAPQQTPVSPTPSPPSPKNRIVADWSELESHSLLNSKPRSEDLVAAFGKFGNEFKFNPHTQRTLIQLESAIAERR